MSWRESLTRVTRAIFPARSEAGGGGDRRPALDGVRAVAVLLVFAFHANVPGMRAGFLGVDLFFVLSGYLITSLLIAEAQRSGRIALTAFWGRRVRRLFPAFVVTVTAVIVVGRITGLPFLREKLRDDVIASLFYFANWRFIRSTSYFANDDTVSPLQHVWSLAIEEQFYVAWPILVALVVLLVTRTKKGNVAVRVGVLAAAGVVASAIAMAFVYSPMHPERAYMGTDTKAFQPMLGALLACVLSSKGVRLLCERASRVLALVGLLGIAGCVLWFRSSHDVAEAYFYGGALVYVVACAALIAGVECGPSFVRTALSWRPIESLGAISYGVYLWHWPLLLWIVKSPDAFRPGRAAAALAATIAISALSYVLVERPVRYGAVGRFFSARRIAVALPVALGVWSGVAAFVLRPPPKEGFTILLIGDSVPKRLLPYVAAEAEKRHWFAYNGSEGGCSTFPSVVVDPKGKPFNDSEDCPHLVTDLQTNGVKKYRPDVIVWWSRYDTTDRKRLSGERLIVGTPEFWAAQREDLRAEIDRLTATGARIVVIEQDRPGQGLFSRCSAKSCHWFVRHLILGYDLAAEWNQMLHETAAADSRIRVISLDDVYCHDGGVPCDDKIGNEWARPDGTHFSPTSGPIVARALLDRIGKR
jgi:peptidoglycan/LPS O-acetylase OafA/YrhL